jgi:transcriptional regulator with XRE-family HTH domain
MNNGLALDLENDHNAAWTERQNQTPEARRHYEQERLILWLTEELASAIEESSLSRREIADKLGTSKAHVTQVLRGRNLTLRTIADIAWATGHRITAHRQPLRDGEFLRCPVTIVRPFCRIVTDDREAQGRAGVPEFMELMEATSP